MPSKQLMEAYVFENEDGSREYDFTFYSKNGGVIGNYAVRKGEVKRWTFNSEKKAELLEKRIAELIEVLSM